MTIQSALNGMNAILAVITKGDADPATKLEAIKELVESARSDIRDLADAEYANYIDQQVIPTFDMESAVEALYTPLSKQIYYNLYDYYNLSYFKDEHDPYMRIAFCKALVRIAIEQKLEANPLWTVIIQRDGEIDEVTE